jgi:16S rRNA C967 or C1407 C5-methylase (RsmB/RsmF family)
LVANDYKGSRLAALGINLQKCGLTNALVTLMEGHWFRGERFDRVLVDAPCSGTGSIRKSYKTLEIWNPEAIKRLSGQQKNLIKSGFRVVKPGGLLVYSTCSVEPEENECVVDFLLGMFPNAVVEEIRIKIKRSEPVLSFEGKSYNPQIARTLRIWPQDNDTGGFFVAKIRKALL